MAIRAYTAPEWERDKERAAQAFCDVVWPIFGPCIQGGYLVDLETSGSPAAKFLDTQLGWDYLQRDCEGWLRPLSVRVQFTDRPYRTFTVRETRSTGTTTELEKRLGAGDRRLLPALFIHAYVSMDAAYLLAAGAVQTDALLTYLRSPGALSERKQANKEGNWFRSVSWQVLTNAGVSVEAWPQ